MKAKKAPLLLLLLLGIIVVPIISIAANVSKPIPVTKSLSGYRFKTIPLTAAQFYLPRDPFSQTQAQAVTYVSEDNVVVLADTNTIYAEFSGLADSEVLNKIIELIEARDERWGFSTCSSQHLNQTFLPFNQYLNISFVDDQGAAMVIVEAAELAGLLSPWGIHFTSQGSLQLSEAALVGEMFLSMVNGEVGMCWGNPTASELILYGNMQGLFDRLSAQYSLGY